MAARMARLGFVTVSLLRSMVSGSLPTFVALSSGGYSTLPDESRKLAVWRNVAGEQVAQADSSLFFLLAADAVLMLHVLFVAFVVIGLVLILAGKAFRWSWVRSPWFRLAHLLAIVVVVVQSWFGAICPLTTLEMMFRSRAGDTVYPGSFVAHWLEAVLYYRAPPWVFAVCYTLFGAVVVGSWFWVRPGRFK